MLAVLLLAAMPLAQEDTPPVPGLCVEPMPAAADTPGCYKIGQIDLIDAPASIYWHVHEFATAAAAASEARRHRWSLVAPAHSRHWLYVLGRRDVRVANGTRRAVVGPMRAPADATTAHFAAAVFPPGMRTRVHSHPGPEAFYVVDGEQCMETPMKQRHLKAGETYIIAAGQSHIQAAPKGRRNLVLILAARGQPSIIPGGNWRPTAFCDE